MGQWKARGLRFGIIRVTGLLLIFLGLALLGVGVSNVIYTAMRYLGDNGCTPAEYIASWGVNPCDDSDVWNFTWAAAPIWSSIVITSTGAIGITMSPKYSGLRLRRNVFAAMTSLSAFVFCGITIALSILEVTSGKDIYYSSTSGELDVRDTTKFVLPILQAILAAVIMFVCLAALLVSCYGVHFYKDHFIDISDRKVYNHRPGHRGRRRFFSEAWRRRARTLTFDRIRRAMRGRRPRLPPRAPRDHINALNRVQPRAGLPPLSYGSMLSYKGNYSDTGYFPHQRAYPSYSSNSTIPHSAYAMPNRYAHGPTAIASRQQTRLPFLVNHGFSASTRFPGYHILPNGTERRSENVGHITDKMSETIDRIFDFGEELSDIGTIRGGRRVNLLNN